MRVRVPVCRWMCSLLFLATPQNEYISIVEECQRIKPCANHGKYTVWLWFLCIVFYIHKYTYHRRLFCPLIRAASPLKRTLIDMIPWTCRVNANIKQPINARTHISFAIHAARCSFSWVAAMKITKEKCAVKFIREIHETRIKSIEYVVFVSNSEQINNKWKKILVNLVWNSDHKSNDKRKRKDTLSRNTNTHSYKCTSARDANDTHTHNRLQNKKSIEKLNY